MLLEDIDTVIGNITKINRIDEGLLQWPVFRKFMVRDDGLPLRFVGLQEHIAALLWTESEYFIEIAMFCSLADFEENDIHLML